MSFAVLGPMPVTLRKGASSSAATARAISSGVERGQNAERRLGSDAGDAAEQVEELELVAGGEAEQAQLVFAHDECGVHERLRAGAHASACAGVTLTCKPTPPTSITTDAARASSTVPRRVEITF